MLAIVLENDPGGTRTHDPRIKSAVLYQLSYGVSFHAIITTETSPVNRYQALISSIFLRCQM
jgi:hypothetical protein